MPLSLFDQSLADMGLLGIIPCSAVGANAIALTPLAAAQAPNIVAYANYIKFAFVAVANSTGPVTISVSGLPFLNAYQDGTNQVGNGGIVAGSIYVVTFASNLNSNNGGFYTQISALSSISGAMSGDATMTAAGVLTIANNAVSYTKLAIAAQGLSNVRLAKTANYTAVNADKGSNIALGGNAFFTLTFGAASGFDANFSVIVTNEDTGRGKLISCNGLSSFILWPGQTALIYASNNVWNVLRPTRWKTVAPTIHVDPVSGSDTNNDGLGTGAGAFQSISGALSFVQKEWDAAGTPIAISLANGTYSTGLPNPVFGGQCGSFLYSLSGAAGQGANVIIAGAIGIKDYAAVSFAELTFSSSVVGGAIAVDQTGIVDIAPTVTFGTGGAAASFSAISVANGGVANFTGFSVNLTSMNILFFATSGGRIVTNGSVINIPNAIAFGTACAFSDMGGLINVPGVTFSGAGVAGCTGNRYTAPARGGGIWTGGGGANYFPGNIAGTATSPGWYG